MFRHIDRFNGTVNKYLIGNLYRDEKGTWKLDIQIGKTNKLTIYARDKKEMINYLSDIAEGISQFIGTMEIIEK